MQKEQTAPLPYGGGGERGAGGKLRKQQARKPPATPYDRPTPNQSSSQRRDGGWLLRLVDPAYRLLSVSATKILPSFFFNQPSEGDNTDEQDVETASASDDDEETRQPAIITSAGGAGPSKVANTPESHSKNNELERDKEPNHPDDNDFSKIEQLIKDKRFSREELSRLTEILNSRVVGTSNLEQERKTPTMTSEGGALGSVLVHDYQRTPVQENHNDVTKAIPGTSTPLLKSNIGERVGASPIDIARAYMGRRISEVDLAPSSILSKKERPLQQSDAYESTPLWLSHTSKSSTCWPGAIVQEQRGSITPRSQRGRFGLHNFPPTPYSKPLYSNCKTESQADNRFLKTSSPSLQQSRTPLYEKARSRTDMFDDVYGSAGPIRRIRRNFALKTPFKNSIISPHTNQNPSPAVEKSFPSESVLNFELESGTSRYRSKEAKTAPNPPPNEAVRKILEHLDRHKPTPKEIESELKLATEWRKSSSELRRFEPKVNTGSQKLGGDLQKNVDIAEQKACDEEGEGKNQEGGANEDDNSSVYASCTAADVTGVTRDTNVEPLFGFKSTTNSQIKSMLEKTDSRQIAASQLWPFGNQANGQDTTKNTDNTLGVVFSKKAPHSFSSSKPILPSISITKPDPKLAFSSDNAPVFSFPVSTSSGVLSEPPTPSIMPSLLAAPKEGPSIPSYTFGNKKHAQRLVFSFPSTNKASDNDGDEGLDVKFNFGSDKKTRVSFSSVAC